MTSVTILDELFSLAHEAEAEMNIVYEQDVPAANARCAEEWGASALVLGLDRSGTAGRVKRLLPEGTQIAVDGQSFFCNLICFCDCVKGDYVV